MGWIAPMPAGVQREPAVLRLGAGVVLLLHCYEVVEKRDGRVTLRLRDLAAEYGVSYGTLKGWWRKLVDEGIVEDIQQHGHSGVSGRIAAAYIEWHGQPAHARSERAANGTENWPVQEVNGQRTVQKTSPFSTNGQRTGNERAVNGTENWPVHDPYHYRPIDHGSMTDQPTDMTRMHATCVGQSSVELCAAEAPDTVRSTTEPTTEPTPEQTLASDVWQLALQRSPSPSEQAELQSLATSNPDGWLLAALRQARDRSARQPLAYVRSTLVACARSGRPPDAPKPRPVPPGLLPRPAPDPAAPPVLTATERRQIAERLRQAHPSADPTERHADARPG